MVFRFFPDDDKHSYIWISIVLIVAANIVVWFLDPVHSRVFTIAGVLYNLAGVYWIAAGVVLRAPDDAKLARVSFSGGPRYIGRDPNKELIPAMLKVQSRRAKVGVLLILIGSVMQIIGVYA